MKFEERDYFNKEVTYSLQVDKRKTVRRLTGRSFSFFSSVLKRGRMFRSAQP